MANFTPVSAAIGGALIGLSAVLIMLLTGRIAGVSGIFGGLLKLPAQRRQGLAHCVHCGRHSRAPDCRRAWLRNGVAKITGQLGRHRSCRTAGRRWYKARRRLHLWRRHLRNRPAIPALHRGHHRVHGDGGDHRGGHASHAWRRAMLIVAPFLCGLIFGAGLLVSGMVQPAKVLAFLDIFGVWDPSLAVVMAAALAVAFPASC